MTTRIMDFHPSIREAWATWEVLRILGFATDDIFWIWQKTIRPAFKGWALNIVLRTQNREFVVTCSEKLRKSDIPVLMERAREFQATLAAGEFHDDVLRETLHTSFVWKNSPELLLALRKSGFVFPYTLKTQA